MPAIGWLHRAVQVIQLMNMNAIIKEIQRVMEAILFTFIDLPFHRFIILAILSLKHNTSTTAARKRRLHDTAMAVMISHLTGD